MTKIRHWNVFRKNFFVAVVIILIKHIRQGTLFDLDTMLFCNACWTVEIIFIYQEKDKDPLSFVVLFLNLASFLQLFRGSVYSSFSCFTLHLASCSCFISTPGSFLWYICNVD